MSASDDWDHNKNPAPGNNSVGYGRPPVAKQFKPGQSGNPRGRKKGVKSVVTIFSDALYKPVKIRTAGRVRTLPKIEAILEIMLNKGLAGDVHAVSKIFELAHKLGGFASLANSTSHSNRESVIERFQRLIDGTTLFGGPGSSEGAPQSNSDQKNPEG